MTDQDAPRGWWIAALFAATSFLGAALLFVVQPLAAKLVLPYFGGSATVWSTSSLLFQVLLLIGYVYAHVATRRLGARWQPRAHLLVLAAPLLVLPVVLPQEAAPPADASPVLWLLRTLVLLVGLPFVVLSTTGPLIQRWYSWANGPRAQDPYFLFAGSNLGSFVGLLAYPFLIEPNLTLTQQRWSWSVTFVVFLALMAGCALLVRPVRAAEQAVSVAQGPSPSRRQYGLWIFWAFVPSSLMLAATSHLSTDIAALPLLWVLPLAAYLVSFVAAFARTSRVVPTNAVLVSVIVAVSTGVVSSVGPVHLIVVMVGLNVVSVGLVGYAAHARLACSRPDPAHLTGFYLVISIGGTFGGLLNGVIAPVLFNRVWEYWISIALVPLLALGVVSAVARRRTVRRWFALGVGAVGVGIAVGLAARNFGVAGDKQLLTAALVVGVLGIVARLAARTPVLLAVTVALAGLAVGVMQQSTSMLTDRTFYGSYRVTDKPTTHTLIHGTTVHGSQLTAERLRGEPTTYYARQGPLGDAVGAIAPDRLGVVGLGAGAIAAYGEPGSSIRFFEIDPVVRDIAEDPSYFTYLDDSAAEVDVVIGDGRLALAAEPRGQFDLLVLDAFSSDSIPVHLMTREAWRTFVSRVAAEGAIMVHISNRVMDLEPVLAGHARALGLGAAIGRGAPGRFSTASKWVVLSHDQELIDGLLTKPRWTPLDSTHVVDWTDDYSSVLSILY